MTELFTKLLFTKPPMGSVDPQWLDFKSVKSLTYQELVLGMTLIIHPEGNRTGFGGYRSPYNGEDYLPYAGLDFDLRGWLIRAIKPPNEPKMLKFFYVDCWLCRDFTEANFFDMIRNGDVQLTAIDKEYLYKQNTDLIITRASWAPAWGLNPQFKAQLHSGLGGAS